MTKTCLDCHTEFDVGPHAKKQKRCSACQKIHKKETKRNWDRAHKMSSYYWAKSRASVFAGNMETAIYTSEIDLHELVMGPGCPVRLIGHLRGGINMEYMVKVKAEVESRGNNTGAYSVSYSSPHSSGHSSNG